jgi:DDE_Tnp_1-associated
VVGQPHSTKLAKFTEPARLKAADGGVADGIGPADVHQGLTGFPSRNGFLPLVVRQFRLAAHHYPRELWHAPGLRRCDCGSILARTLPSHRERSASACRAVWVMYPLREVLLLVTCATIASCDDFDDIVGWGEHHLDFLRRFAEFHHGIPCERWLRALVNRIDPILFGRCFESWVAALWPGRHEFIAIDGKTSRRTHDTARGSKPYTPLAPTRPRRG